jgi:hypothetical protein
MYGDADLMRKRVDQLREQAVDLRGLADVLVAQTEAVPWTGRAADAMRERVKERAAHLRAAAADHDTAADSLARHAQEVVTLKDAIADAERRVSTLGDEPGSTEFTPPASGHKDWLAVSLPGL